MTSGFIDRSPLDRPSEDGVGRDGKTKARARHDCVSGGWLPVKLRPLGRLHFE
jgi:hypothetical protein